jgi:hypothetical protein
LNGPGKITLKFGTNWANNALAAAFAHMSALYAIVFPLKTAVRLMEQDAQKPENGPPALCLNLLKLAEAIIFIQH